MNKFVWLFLASITMATQQNCAGPDHKEFKHSSFSTASAGLPAGASLQVDQVLQAQSCKFSVENADLATIKPPWGA